jgi:hypothetical protein
MKRQPSLGPDTTLALRGGHGPRPRRRAGPRSGGAGVLSPKGKSERPVTGPVRGPSPVSATTAGAGSAPPPEGIPREALLVYR